MSNDKYFDHAEYLIVKGYMPDGTNVDDLAIRLAEHAAKIERNNIQPKADMMTRESVYGKETAKYVDAVVKSMQPVSEILLSPEERESAALAKAHQLARRDAT